MSQYYPPQPQSDQPWQPSQWQEQSSLPQPQWPPQPPYGYPQHYPPPQQWQQPIYPYPMPPPYYQQQPYYPQPFYPPPMIPPIMVSQTMNMVNMRTQQVSFLARLLYFVFIGWWLGLMWACIALAFCASIIGIPIGLVMLNFLPVVLTLQRH